MKTEWIILKSEEVALHESHVVSKLLWNRGHKDVDAVKSFLNPTLSSIIDPFLGKIICSFVSPINTISN